MLGPFLALISASPLSTYADLLVLRATVPPTFSAQVTSFSSQRAIASTSPEGSQIMNLAHVVIKSNSNSGYRLAMSNRSWKPNNGFELLYNSQVVYASPEGTPIFNSTSENKDSAQKTSHLFQLRISDPSQKNAQVLGSLTLSIIAL